VTSVADAHACGTTPVARGEKQKAQPRRGQGGVLDGLQRGLLLTMEQLQPTIQVLGQHGDVEPVVVCHPAVRTMRGQAGIVIGFLDEVLGRGAMVVKPDG
jgi:hypothetical protein